RRGRQQLSPAAQPGLTAAQGHRHLLICVDLPAASDVQPPRDCDGVVLDAGAALMSRRRRSSRGQTAAEFAMVLPVLLLLLFGSIDFGGYFGSRMSVQNAVR